MWCFALITVIINIPALIQYKYFGFEQNAATKTVRDLEHSVAVTMFLSGRYVVMVFSVFNIQLVFWQSQDFSSFFQDNYLSLF